LLLECKESNSKITKINSRIFLRRWSKRNTSHSKLFLTLKRSKSGLVFSFSMSVILVIRPVTCNGITNVYKGILQYRTHIVWAIQLGKIDIKIGPYCCRNEAKFITWKPVVIWLYFVQYIYNSLTTRIIAIVHCPTLYCINWMIWGMSSLNLPWKENYKIWFSVPSIELTSLWWKSLYLYLMIAWLFIVCRWLAETWRCQIICKQNLPQNHKTHRNLKHHHSYGSSHR
jgi:hypothetical protein